MGRREMSAPRRNWLSSLQRQRPREGGGKMDLEAGPRRQSVGRSVGRTAHTQTDTYVITRGKKKRRFFVRGSFRCGRNALLSQEGRKEKRGKSRADCDSRPQGRNQEWRRGRCLLIIMKREGGGQ